MPNNQYINGYKQFEKEQIYIPQYALGGNLQCAFGSIKQIYLYKNEITYLVTTLSGPSGSPILIYKKIIFNKNLLENDYMSIKKE